MLRKRLRSALLPSAPDDQIEVVRPDTPRAEELQRARGQEVSEPARARRERRDGDQVSARAHVEDGEPPTRAEVRPPCEEPLPGQEQAVAGTLGEERSPLLLEAFEGPGVLDAL